MYFFTPTYAFASWGGQAKNGIIRTRIGPKVMRFPQYLLSCSFWTWLKQIELHLSAARILGTNALSRCRPRTRLQLSVTTGAPLLVPARWIEKDLAKRNINLKEVWLVLVMEVKCCSLWGTNWIFVLIFPSFSFCRQSFKIRNRILLVVCVQICSGCGQVAGSCEGGNEPPGYIKCGWISWLAEKLLASQEGVYSMEFGS
jgi:hypothetical protein